MRIARWAVRLLVLWALLLCAASLVAQPPAESSWGRGEVPPVVGMTDGGCAGIILATGTVDAAAHALDTGYFAIGEATLLLNPKGIPWAQMRSLLGREQELVIRPVKCRAQERLER